MVTVSQITPITITDLPDATTLTGNEAVPVVQDNQTVQVSVNALPQGMTAGVVTYGNTGGSPFPNYRTLKGGSGININDGGAQGDLTLSVLGGTGTVNSVSVVTANGVSGTVANATTAAAITLSLGAITPSSVTASGAVTGSNLTGTNTGNVTLTGKNYLSIAGQTITVGAINLAGTDTTGNLPVTSLGSFASISANSFVPNSATVPIDGMYLPSAHTVAVACNSGRVIQYTLGGAGGNYIQATAAAAGGLSTIGSNGTDSSGSLGLVNVGSASIYVYTGFSSLQAEFIHASSPSSRIQFTGGNNIVTISSAGGTFADIAITPNGTGLVKFGNSASFTANGTVATLFTSLGPTGASTTIRKWLTVKDSAGTTYYIPAY